MSVSIGTPFTSSAVKVLLCGSGELGKEVVSELQRYAERHNSPFPILADEGGVIHGQYSIRHSWIGVLKGMLFRFPSLLYAMFKKGYVPLTIGGRMNTMPADFLVDRQGTIQEAYYGRDEGDHLDFERIRQFAWQQAESQSSNR